jgi:hypothetical protein
MRWRLEAIHAEQRRCVDLLGLAQYPPNRLFWTMRDLFVTPLRPEAPRLGWRRRLALLQRLDALESLRVLSHAPGIMALCKQVGSPADLSPPEGLREHAEDVIHRTGWAVRRGPCDPRSSRGGPAAGLTTNRLYD